MRTKQRITSAAIAVALSLTSACAKPVPQHSMVEPVAVPVYELNQDGMFNYAFGPMKLLAMLKERKEVSVEPAPRDWIKDSDVRSLARYVDSQEPCGFICSRLSSWMPIDEKSTVGAECRFILKGYRDGKFPPALDSRQNNLTVDEAKSWLDRRPNSWR